MELSGKVALVTGSSRGIGKAIAEALAQKGCKVVVNYAKDKENAELVAQSVNGIAVQADVSNEQECKQMIDIVFKEHGRIDILVNNAGIVKDRTFKKMSKEEWDKVIDVDLTSMYTVTKPFIEVALQQQSGKIVNVASVSGQMGFFGQTNYSAAKAGVIGFTKALAREVAAKGITVNAVAPGIINVGLGATIPEEVLKKFLEHVPLGRVGTASEIAHAVIFCLENDYMTGQVVSVNGGMYM